MSAVALNFKALFLGPQKFTKKILLSSITLFLILQMTMSYTRGEMGTVGSEYIVYIPFCDPPVC